MNLSIFISLVALTRLGSCTPYPTLEWEPNTAEDCVDWYNNSDIEWCEFRHSTLKQYFSKWNPSVGVDCKPWNHQSYCIVTQERLDNTPIITTTSTSTATLGPSPTSWMALGCYVEDSERPVLDKNVSPEAGDATLTIPKCKATCYRQSYGFAGVQEGSQCWCGSYVGGERESNQILCNVPCTGDKTTFCGGKRLISIFQAEESPIPANTTTEASIDASTPTETILSASYRDNARAVRNSAIFEGLLIV
ncbi:hypothetical protein GGR58DRAFT_525123 [Xylaria digitata]|nr:hypothetical protein GGR58DRAFT_525123 [Xylaria digitata]